jgi:hypothetical protein
MSSSVAPSSCARQDFSAGGETGHSHVIRQVVVLAPSVEGDLATLELDGPRTVEHEQHSTFVLPTGAYRAYRVRDANPQRQGE